MFLEQDGEEVVDSVPDADTLPVATRRADTILTVEVTDGTLTQVTYEPDRTKSQKQAAQDRFDRLSSRPPRDDDST